VLLYELLTGTTPVDRARLKQAAVLEVLRVVREEEPPRPSVKLTTAEARASIAATRGTDPGRLARLLRGELDWIVMRCLEKDRNRRYDTAAGLARDVQRYLADEVVEARRPSAGYRLRRLVRKNRAALLVGGLVVGLLKGWVFTAQNAWWEVERALASEQAARVAAEEQRAAAERARRAADENAGKAAAARFTALADKTTAEAKAREAQAVLGFLSNVVIQGQMDEFFQDNPEDITLRKALIRSEPMVAQFFAGRPTAEATVRYLFGVRVLGLGDAAADREFAVRQLERALALRRRVLGPAHPETVDTAVALAAAHGLAGHPDRAVEVLEETRAAGADLPAEKRDALTDALAGGYAEVGRFDESVALHRELLARPGESATRAYTLRDLGQVLLRAGRPADAEPAFREAAGLLEKNDPADWLRHAVAGDLGASLLDQRKYAEAEPLLLSAYDGLKRRESTDLRKGPTATEGYLTEAVDRLVRLHEATDRPERAAEWRAKRVPPLAPPPRPVAR
jgi:tetratricopeptide (TPR) repeat protein